MSRTWIALAACVALLGACDDETPDPDRDGGADAATPEVDAGPGEDLLRDDCEALVPEYCALPFPSDYWLAEDSSTASGNRLNLGETTLPRANVPPRRHVDPAVINARDGWSINASILAYLPDADPEGLPDPDHIADSIAMDSPTVLMNAETGERVPHFAELDLSTRCPPGFSDCDGDILNGCETDLLSPSSCGSCDVTCSGGQVCASRLCRDECQTGQTLVDGACVDQERVAICGEPGFPCEPYPLVPRTLIIRPVVPLAHETRYVVAVRGVVNRDGAVIAPPETFAALRDGSDTEVASLDARRDHFEGIFTTLSDNGVMRDDLQLAWDFTTSSVQDDTGWLVSARDQALAWAGDDGPAIRFETEEPYRCGTPMEDFTPEENANIRRRLNLLMEVPLFTDVAEAGARLNLGADGMPAMNGTAEYCVLVNIPHSATPDTPSRPLQYGHGLLGSRYESNTGWAAEWANDNNYIVFAVDWKGMAEDDIGPITVALARGTIEDFATVPERLVQGITNALLAMRMMLTRAGTHEAFQIDGRSVIDTTEAYYTGDSQGGIFGGTYMALTTDVLRGRLGVPGQPYNLLLNRSVDFDPYLALLRQSFSDGPNIQIAISAMQLLWDRSEPGSFTSHIMNDPLPGTPAHQVLVMPALGDHQVSTLAAHVMARAIGAVTIMPQTRPVWGIEEVAPPHMGSALIEFDYGLPPDPIYNIPQRAGEDPHGQPRRNPRSLEQTAHFYETGEVIHTCDGPCDPE